MSNHMELEFNIRGEATGRRRPDQPFNLLVLGDFSGDAVSLAGEVPEEISKRRIVHIDLDNADELWAVFSPHLQIQVGSASIEITPRDIDDFHPDQLYRTLPVFKRLREIRKTLLDPVTAQSALEKILATGAVIEDETENDPVQRAVAEQGEDTGQIFERLLGKSARQSHAREAETSELDKLDAFIRETIAPHIVNDPDPRVDTAIESVDMAIAEMMRDILHHADFQSLESCWRSLLDLLAELELDENLHLYVCDIRREELLAGLPDTDNDLQDSPLFQLLVERRRQATDDTPWTVILGDYYFSKKDEDISLLTTLGAAAAMNGGVFLAGARPDILGCSSSAELADPRHWSSASEDCAVWQSLRTTPIANRIGLALPRVLARLPYGKQTEEIDSFNFEEMPRHNHDQYLWANPAFACGRLLATSFTRHGWNMEPGDHVDLGNLPAHHYKEGGESRLQPCAELLLSEPTMMAMLEQGLMPVVSYRNRNTAVLGRFQSIADPLAPLSGPWQR